MGEVRKADVELVTRLGDSHGSPLMEQYHQLTREEQRENIRIMVSCNDSGCKTIISLPQLEIHRPERPVRKACVIFSPKPGEGPTSGPGQERLPAHPGDTDAKEQVHPPAGRPGRDDGGRSQTKPDGDQHEGAGRRPESMVRPDGREAPPARPRPELTSKCGGREFPDSGGGQEITTKCGGRAGQAIDNRLQIIKRPDGTIELR